MKKIGVLTFHRSENYGAYLQCYALQKTLKEKAYNVSVINYVTEADIKKYRLLNTSSLKNFMISVITLADRLKRRKNFDAARKYLRYSNINEQYDIAIVGSDQMWNPDLSGGSLDPFYTLKEIKANRKISYAVSTGNSDNVNKYSNVFLELLKDLDYISVREETTAIKMRKITPKDIEVVLDPVFLLSREEWEKEIAEKCSNKNDSLYRKKYILSYFISSKPLEQLELLSEKVGLGVIGLAPLPLEKHLIKHAYSKGPFEFVKLIKNAKIVATTSFHGVAFSILLNKDFYVLTPKKETRDRIDNLLNALGIENRIIENKEQLEGLKIEKIDYTKVNARLGKLRKESLSWLVNALEN